MEEVVNLINICPTNPVKILNQHGFFFKILYVSFKWYFSQKWKKISMLVLGLHSIDGMSTKDIANIRNPKVNRGCPPLTSNRTSADCVQISLGPPIQYIPLGVYCTVGFSAMYLNQYWPDSLMHIYVTRGRWVQTAVQIYTRSNHHSYHVIGPSCTKLFFKQNANCK